MKAVRLYGVGDVRLVQEDAPVAGPGEALLKVTSVGLCGSDLHWFSEAGIGDAQLAKPLVLGHEFAAVVLEGDRKGERVAVDPAVVCGRCRFCLEGNPNFCLSQRFAGHGEQDGALREVVAWPEGNLFPLPDSLSDADGAMLELLGVAIHSVDLAHLRTGMRVGVFGCGPIGLLIIQLARLAGATQVVATDVMPHRVEAARSVGASEAFLACRGEEVAQIQAATQGEGVDVVFEVAGDNAAVETAVAAVRPGARVILIGIPSDDRTGFQASVARRKGLTFLLCRRMKHTYPRAIHLVEQGLVDVRSLVTHRFAIEAFAQAFSTAARREGLKIVIEP